MLEVRALTGGWGPTTIVEGVSLEVAAGETVAIIGRNGVGKTTLLELIADRACRVAGSIRIEGQEVSGLPTHRRARLGLGYVPQAREVFASLTVGEHIDIAAQPGAWTRKRVLDLFPSLAERIGSRAGLLSGGEQQMLAIARALLCNPKALLMDEPSEGLAPVVVEHLARAIRALCADGSMAILLVEQRIDVALDLADRYLVMDRGRIAAAGATSELRERSEDLPILMGLAAGETRNV
jgi:branched-chain amino acid transport system ATP-binding protein